MVPAKIPAMIAAALTLRFIQYSFVCLYATIIAFGDLLVNHPKVVPKYYSVETMR
jgi:hypothetical protein